MARYWPYKECESINRCPDSGQTVDVSLVFSGQKWPDGGYESSTQWPNRVQTVDVSLVSSGLYSGQTVDVRLEASGDIVARLWM